MSDDNFTQLSNGYWKGPELDRGAQGIIYAGKTPDGQACIHKEYKCEQAQHEYDMLMLVRERNPKLSNVVYCYTSLQQNGHLLITEEALGRPLTEMLLAGPLNPRTLAYLGIGSSRALMEISRAGIVHNDVKWDNFMTSRQHERCVLIDLGVACKVGETPRGHSEIIAAPEVMAGKTSPTSDSYPWARNFELILTGYHDVGPKHRVTDSPNARWVSHGFAEVIRTCTDEDPAKRIPPTQLAQQVRAALSYPVDRGGGMQFPDAPGNYPY